MKQKLHSDVRLTSNTQQREVLINDEKHEAIFKPVPAFPANNRPVQHNSNLKSTAQWEVWNENLKRQASNKPVHSFQMQQSLHDGDKV